MPSANCRAAARVTGTVSRRWSTKVGACTRGRTSRTSMSWLARSIAAAALGVADMRS